MVNLTKKPFYSQEFSVGSSASYIIRRLLWMIPVFCIVSFGTFLLTRYAPGDPILVRAGPRADPEVIERIRHELKLDEPIPVQYIDYMAGFFTGDLGESISKYPGTPVADLVFPRIAVSAQLGFVALLIIFVLGGLIGIVAALNHGKWKDPFLISVCLFFHSIPSIVGIPILLYVLVLQFHLVPASGWDGIFSPKIIIPLLVFTLPALVGPARLMRNTLLTVMGQDYIRTARAKGLPESSVVGKHALRNALLPMTTVVGLSLVSVFEGSFFVEQLYGIPGIGVLSLEAVYARDYDIIMALAQFSLVLFLVFQLLTDIVYSLLDPRIRLDTSESN